MSQLINGLNLVNFVNFWEINNLSTKPKSNFEFYFSRNIQKRRKNILK